LEQLAAARSPSDIDCLITLRREGRWLDNKLIQTTAWRRRAEANRFGGRWALDAGFSEQGAAADWPSPHVASPPALGHSAERRSFAVFWRSLMSTLMSNVYWALGRKKYAAYGDFVAAVSDYNQKVSPGSSGWDPEKQISQTPITIVYEAGWKDEDDTIEVVLGERGKPLTMGQALFTLNNATVEFFEDADHCFFEGLAPRDGTEYELLTGS
jgi:hypothetical protein